MTQPKTAFSIKVNQKKVVRILLVIAGVLLLGHLAGLLAKFVFHHTNVLGLVPFFYFDQEKNAPTFFQASVLGLNACLLLLITILEGQNKTKRWGYFLVLTIGFLYMAIDEWKQFHELLSVPLQNWIGTDQLGVFTFTWVIGGILAVILAVLIFYRFLAGLEVEIRRQFILAAALYVTGAIGFELLGGYFAATMGYGSSLYQLEVTCEETLEMAGMILMIRALLRYLPIYYPSLSLETSFIKGQPRKVQEGEKNEK
jgi:hypothetical protein